MSSPVAPSGNAYGVRVNGGSGDGGGWRGYERPDSPEPESPPPTPDWRVYGDRSDPPGLRATAGQPAPPYGSTSRRSRRKGGLPGWRHLPLGKKIRTVIGGGFVGGWALLSVVGAITGDDSVHTQEAVPAQEARVDTLAHDSLEILERKLLRETGSTRVAQLIVNEQSIVVQVVDGLESAVYNWRGGRLIRTGTQLQMAPEFDLADVDLAAIGRAGRRAQHLVDDLDSWWVTVGVAEGGTEPLITAQALGDASGAKVTLTGSGEVADMENW